MSIMQTDHFLNFRALDRDQRVYRYLNLEKLIDLFEHRQNVLVHPSKWEDPWENFVLNAQGRNPAGSLREFGFRDRIYGQCWTIESRSDAMWRIYSPAISVQRLGEAAEKRFEGVRIRTTLGKLADSLTVGMTATQRDQTFVGKVEYRSDRALFAMAKIIFADQKNPARVAQSLLLKRTPFRHEKEVRLIFRNFHGQPFPGGLFNYDVDPHHLVDQILIDPRCKLKHVAELKDRIRMATGYSGRLLFSLLYQRPRGMIVDVG